MKFTNDSALKYLSVKLPYLGAFLILAASILQWTLDYKIMPLQYQLIVSTIILPMLSHLGKKIYQPELHDDQPD
ncbi:hypothetical protein C9426_01540 [Serratia sp. S1B]|nr:hypothetical protein C9426_01540 [Serratia sp. S1B]